MGERELKYRQAENLLALLKRIGARVIPRRPMGVWVVWPARYVPSEELDHSINEQRSWLRHVALVEQEARRPPC